MRLSYRRPGRFRSSASVKTMTSDKKSIRAQSLDARTRISPDERKAASMEVARKLVQLIPETAEIVAGYRAVRGEIDIFEAMAQLSERGHELCLPVVVAPRKPLIFRRWHIGHPLEMGQLGIEIPPESEPVLLPDVILAPLAAFDAKGYRLGYGSGFYDITIHHLRQLGKHVHIIGVGFSLQQVKTIPAEDHDEKLDAVVTEKGVVIVARAT